MSQGEDITGKKSNQPVPRMQNPEYKAMLWKAVNKRRADFELRNAAAIRTALNKELSTLAKEITPDNMRDPDVVNVIESKYIESALLAVYVTVGVSFARDMYSKLNGTKEIKPVDWAKYFRDYLLNESGKLITSIAGESKRQALKIIRSVLAQSADLGWGAIETAKAIQKDLVKQGQEINLWRSMRIARTETMVASNLGSKVGAESTGYALKKYWIATYDNRTRDTHLVVEQQNPLAKDDKFKVGEYDMEYPGDPSGGVEEIVNCRCVITYEII